MNLKSGEAEEDQQ